MLAYVLDMAGLVAILFGMTDLYGWAEVARCLYAAESFCRDALAVAPSDWQRDQIGKALSALVDVTDDALGHLASRLKEQA